MLYITPEPVLEALQNCCAILFQRHQKAITKALLPVCARHFRQAHLMTVSNPLNFWTLRVVNHVNHPSAVDFVRI